MEQHPDMELAVVARTTGLTECLKHEKIAASAKAVDATDSGNTETSLLQATKVCHLQKICYVHSYYSNIVLMHIYFQAFKPTKT